MAATRRGAKIGVICCENHRQIICTFSNALQPKVKYRDQRLSMATLWFARCIPSITNCPIFGFPLICIFHFPSTHDWHSPLAPYLVVFCARYSDKILLWSCWKTTNKKKSLSPLSWGICFSFFFAGADDGFLLRCTFGKRNISVACSKYPRCSLSRANSSGVEQLLWQSVIGVGPNHRGSYKTSS